MGVFDEVDKQIAAERGVAPPAAPALSDTGVVDYNARYGPAPADAPATAPQTTYKGSLLPFSRDAQGNVSFDPFGAGPIGALRQAFTLPGRVQSGEVKVDPSDPKFIGETLNFAGSFGSAVNPAIRSGDRVIPGVTRNAPDPMSVPAPSVKDLLEKGGAQIENFQKAPVRYDPAHAPVLAQQIETALIKDGVHATDSPALYAAIERLRANKGLPGDEVLFTPGNLHSIRKNFANQFGKAGEDQHGVGIAFKQIDDFIKNPPASAVLAGPAAEAGREFARGAGNYAAGKRGEALESIKRTADLRTASAHSGQNADNTLRSRITSHVLDDRKVKGYTPAEIAMLEAVPTGTATNNALRMGSNLLGGGGGVVGAGAAGSIAYGLGSLFGLGTPAATAVGVAAPVIGNVLRRLAGKGTKEALDEASHVLRQRSPLFQAEMKAYGAPRDPVRDAMARTLMRMEGQAGQGVPVDQPIVPEGDPLRITVTPRR